ncbi:zinc finger, CCHC-type containing protein [Tanacetum coccineum]
MPEDGGDNRTVEQVRKRSMWDNDDYVCRGLILNGMSDPLFDMYQNVESSKELWDSLEAKYMADDASSKKFLVSNFTNYKMTYSIPVLEQYNKLLGILGRFTQHKINMDESIQVSCIIDKLPPSLKDFKHALKHLKEELTLVELGSHLRIEESFKVQDSDKPKRPTPVVLQLSIWWSIITPPGTMTTRVNVNIMIIQGLILTRRLSLLVRNMEKLVTLKGIAKVLMLAIKPMDQAQSVQWMDDDVVWWVDSGATVHVCKDRCWFKTYESLNDGSILHIGNESTALVHERGCVDLRFSSGKIVYLLNVLHVPNIRKNLVSSIILNNYGYKQVIKYNKLVLPKHGVFIGFGYLSNHMFKLNIVNDNIGSTFMLTSKLNDSILWHARLGHIHFKRMQDMSKDGLISAFDMDFENDLCDVHDTPSLGNKKYFVTFIDDASKFCYVYLLHTKDEALDKFKVFKTEVELQQGSLIKRFRTDRGGEYMDTLYFQSVGLSQGLWGETMAVVRLPDPKLKILGEIGIECIFVGYAEHSKAFRFYVIEPNDLVSINSIIELKDAIFDENKFSSVPRPSLRILNVTEDIGGSMVPEEVVQQPEPELKKSKRNRTPKDFGPEFQLYLIEGTRDEKEAINDEMNSIMGNNTWVLTDLPLGCKWIFKRKLKVDGTIENFKARLVIQGFRQKSGIDYFDTYALVARISTIRLLIAIGLIHNLIIHQMDMKTAFLNGELDEEVYMNQPQGFIMHGNENKVCKLIKSLYELKQSPKQWHQKFDEIVLSNGYLLNQANKFVYSKFDETGKGVIICLYVDDMLIFGTDQVQIDLTKEFLSSRFSMKDIGKADVILSISIKNESNGIAISQSHYIEKVLKKFNYFDCTPVSTPMDTSEMLMPNNGQVVSQLEYFMVIGCLIYDMTYTRPDIAFVVCKLSTYISNPVLEGYTDASWINNTKDNLSTNGWVFLLGGGAISWASKKQTCITGSIMEYEFVALTTAGKKAEWLKKLLLEIPLWVKPMAPISSRYDIVATLAKAYSQMYNGKSRHLGVRHSIIRELITNGVISIEFVRSQQNLADYFTKGLARDLIIKSAEGMGFKSN